MLYIALCRPLTLAHTFRPRLLTLVFFLFLLLIASPATAWAHVHKHAAINSNARFAESFLLSDLDNESAQWSIYQDGGNDTYSLSPVDNPSLDGQALSLSLLGGTPYTGIHAYRTLPQIDATTFELQASFYLVKQENLQGLELTMDQWHANKRLEWAMQWEQFGDGTIQEGIAPTWRIWTGENWQNTGISQSLALNTWHTFTLTGDTVHGLVRYQHFQCDDLSLPLSLVFPPTNSSGEKIVLGAQIDGNSQEAPATVILDHLNLSIA